MKKKRKLFKKGKWYRVMFKDKDWGDMKEEFTLDDRQENWLKAMYFAQVVKGTVYNLKEVYNAN